MARFPSVTTVDLGGGLGVPERATEPPLDLDALGAVLTELHNKHPTLALWLEPGRYLVAEAGVLLAQVTQLKGKGEVKYVGIATGMNSLIRPALYGAHHDIVNLTRLDEAASELVNIVGPICESGDQLGNDRLLPPTQEGDVLLIANAGAYGYAMSSNYNLRAPAQELVI
jgi:diaminopimelate decarboxylase/aspartate kinase